MRRRFKLLLLAPIFLVSLGAAPAVVIAAVDCSAPTTPADAIQCGANTAAGVPSDASPSKSLDTTITNAINLLSLAVGVVAVIMVIIGGLRYTTSGGNQEKVKGAKNTIIYAAIGLIVVALAQIIVRFVINQSSVK